MHFKCVKCPNEFCSGCRQLFKQGQVSLRIVCGCIIFTLLSLGVWQVGVMQVERSSCPPPSRLPLFYEGL